MVQRDPFWIDFDTAIALRGQLEQAKLEEEALEESKRSSKTSKYDQLNSKYGKNEPYESLADKLKSSTIKRPEDIIKERGQGGVSSPKGFIGRG